MADRSAASTQKRLSVWAATEPLPAPLPPPPRIQHTSAPTHLRVEIHTAHHVPPEPHLFEPVATPVRPTADVAVPSTPERTYRWPSVLAAGAISVILVGSIGWLQIYQPQELDWPTMKSMVLGRSFERMVPESELPYVTVMPLVPISNKPNIVKRESKTSTQLR